jgi:Na+-driven multidrug efflux pump
MGVSKTNIDMLNGPLGRKILRFAIPIALSSIFQQMFNLADVAVVGQFAGDKTLAAVGANTFVINMLINLFVGISVGGKRGGGQLHRRSQLPLRDTERPHVRDGGIL